MPPTDEARQRADYQATATSYDQHHVGEHCPFLDVGAGTGRAMNTLATALPRARVQGIDPVADLRQQASMLNGISRDNLREGVAPQLPFAEDNFDWVMQTHVPHHIRHWTQAVAEMARVAFYGVLISGTNNIGQGSPRARKLKQLIKTRDLWTAFVWLQTIVKLRKWSEGDGMSSSFFGVQELPLLRGKFAQVRVMNTQGGGNADLLGTVRHVAIVARLAT